VWGAVCLRRQRLLLCALGVRGRRCARPARPLVRAALPLPEPLLRAVAAQLALSHTLPPPPPPPAGRPAELLDAPWEAAGAAAAAAGVSITVAPLN
jgi:hypothetical protein